LKKESEIQKKMLEQETAKQLFNLGNLIFDIFASVNKNLKLNCDLFINMNIIIRLK